jgi:hypothetical protein
MQKSMASGQNLPRAGPPVPPVVSTWLRNPNLQDLLQHPEANNVHHHHHGGGQASVVSFVRAGTGGDHNLGQARSDAWGSASSRGG